jgi:hypothetical protein
MSLGNSVSPNLEEAGALSRIDSVRDMPLLAQDSGLKPPPQADETLIQPNCSICDGAGWVKEAVPFGHPSFGVLFPCQCKQAERARRTAEELARLSNLDAVRDKTFATFNPFVPGLREVVPRIRS